MEVRDSGIHGRGVFASRDIPKGTRVMEYLGEKITKAESERRAAAQMEAARRGAGAVYIFELNKRHDIDGNFEWNTARLANHSCDPNCETVIDRGRIWVETLRDVFAGEELTYNYGYDLEDFEDHPCRCGAAGCVGFILAEEFWPELKLALGAASAPRSEPDTDPQTPGGGARTGGLAAVHAESR